MAIAAIEGSKFWKACTHDVTSTARHHERLRHDKYEHENTKNGQITPSPHAGAARECTPAQRDAEMTASQTCRLVINDNIRSTPPMSSVSNGGLIITIIINRPIAGPSNSGPVSCDNTPVNPKVSTIISDGTRLISPVRRTYFHIEIWLSKSRESNHSCFLSSIVVSCSGSKFNLHKCSENYKIQFKNTMIKLHLL